MYDPKDILSRWALEEHQGHLFNLKQALFHLVNYADDLHIGALTDDHLDVIYAMQRLIESRVLYDGDGEEHDQ